MRCVFLMSLSLQRRCIKDSREGMQQRARKVDGTVEEWCGMV